MSTAADGGVSNIAHKKQAHRSEATTIQAKASIASPT
jgi:hypothetical protein